MAIVLFGLNFRTAPVELREKLSLSGATLQLALDRLKNGHTASSAQNPVREGFDEVVILSTCNRVEVYVDAGSGQSEAANEIMARTLASISGIAVDLVHTHSYQLPGDEAIHHLMRVACGLDSMFLGETQILGQVSQSFEAAHAAGTTGPILSHLFASATHAGKRARSETDISRNTTSVSHAAALRIAAEVADICQAKMLVVGAGESAVLAAQALKHLGATELTFVNRTLDRAEALAAEFEGKALAWYRLDEAIAWSDAVIFATGAPHIVLSRRDVEEIVESREGRTLVLVDIAVPRDIEDTVKTLQGISYYGIDCLQSVVDANLELRRAVIPLVEQIIEDESRQFTEWARGRQVLPVIRELREQAQNIAQEELQHMLRRLPDADERTTRLVNQLVNQLVNRLLHEPTTRLRLKALDGTGAAYADAIRHLFDLQGKPQAAPAPRPVAPPSTAPVEAAPRAAAQPSVEIAHPCSHAGRRAAAKP